MAARTRQLTKENVSDGQHDQQQERYQRRDKAIEIALGAIDKQFGKGSIMRLGKDPLDREVHVVPTGSLGLDLALGIGGLPRGRIVEIYGPESSGKTTLTLHIVAEAQKRGGVSRVHRCRARARRQLRQEARRQDRGAPGQPAGHGEQALEIADMLVRSARSI
jgi:recombination protein RecA